MKQLACLLIVIAIILFTYPTSNSSAAGGLGELTALINTSTPLHTAFHQISFSLPLNAPPQLTTDYIIIYLQHFTDITPPNSITGSYSGTPNISVDGNYVKITGIGFTPGTTITIDGMSATNPQLENQFQIMVLLSQDEAGSIVKNIGHIVATTGGTQISVTASIDSPEARLEINGYAAPNSFITFTSGGAVYGTTISTELGFFSKIFSGLPPGDQNITIQSVDQSNLSTAPHSIYVYAPAYQQTTVSNILLSPTMQLSSTSILQGDNLIISGSAKPGSSITLFTQSPLRTHSASSSALGTWNYTINNTNEYLLGDYLTFSIAQNDFGLQSLTSITQGFTIISSSTVPGDACGNISRGDLNCDNQINLTDFSILMFYWGTTNATADINNDNIVNLTDFSIMMYWWGT